MRWAPADLYFIHGLQEGTLRVFILAGMIYDGRSHNIDNVTEEQSHVNVLEE